MNNTNPTAMQAAIAVILQQHHLTELFEAASDFHLKIENAPYLPLVIERHGSEVSVAHYFTQNGDAMRDPEMTFELPDWRPTSITQDPIAHYACVDNLSQGSRQRARLLSDLKSFALTWARNIQAQGFAGADATVTSLTHQAVLDCRAWQDEPAPDCHLEMLYEERTAGDYEPFPYDGTYSEE